jgi:hypothetical protein
MDAGRLEVKINGDYLSAAYQPDKAAKQTYLFSVAVLGSNLHTEIEAGENRGRKLPQDFVTLGYKAIPPNDANKWRTELPRFTLHPGARYALAAWVSLPDDQTPLQASGGWLPMHSPRISDSTD